MLFLEEDAPLLKAWIVKRLEAPASRTDADVDADVLADYVLALLRHDSAAGDVRKLCEEELVDFLKEGPFVKDVFEALAYKSFRPGARPPPPPGPPASGTAAAAPSDGFGSRKRSYHESSLLLPQPPSQHLPLPDMASNGADVDGWDAYYASLQGEIDGRGGRPVKQARRGGAFHGGRGHGGGAGAAGPVGPDFRLPPAFVPGGGLGPLHPNGNGAAAGANNGSGSSQQPSPLSMDEILQMQQHLGLPLPPMYAHFGQAMPHAPGAPPRPRPCRHFQKRGFCSRPNCRFDHTAAAMAPTPAAHGSPMAFPQDGGGMFPMVPPLPLPYFSPPHLVPPPGEPSSLHPGKQRPSRRGGGKAPFSGDGPVPDPRHKTTVVVEGIPDEHLSEAAVREYFGQFGELASVTLQPKRRLALVQYGAAAGAQAAYQSPKAVFDNRFVKVYWYKGEAAARKARGEAGASGESGEHGESGETGADGDADALDMEAFLQRQAEAQRLHEEKAQRKRALEEQRQALEQRQRELLAQQVQARQQLVAKMAAVATRTKRQRSGSPGTLSADGSSGSGSGSGSQDAAARTQTEMIRAQLAALEEEAKMLGLDPEAIVSGGASGGREGSSVASANGSDAVLSPSASWAPRGGGGGGGGGGGYYARGRGRGRGGSMTRGVARGRGASAYAAYTLDNRPRTVCVGGVDFSAPDKDEALRQCLLAVGDYTAIETTAEGAMIAFADRRTAEKFYYGLPRAPAAAADGQPAPSADAAPRLLPGVDTPVVLRWVANTASTASTASTAAAATAGAGALRASGPSDEAVRRGAADGGGGGGKGPADEAEGPLGGENDETEEGEVEEAEQGGQQQRPRVARAARAVDFDVADEDWGMA